MLSVLIEIKLIELNVELFNGRQEHYNMFSFPGIGVA